jgi:O-antigen ligase
MRAFAVTGSGLIVFWVARALASAGLRRALVVLLVTAVVIGAGTGLLQAYGLRTEYASLSRAPGGTFGNRNFMAHLCAIGTPLLIWCTVTSKRTYGLVLGVIAQTMLAAALVLSRSRAAWVALAIGALMLLIPAWLTGRRVGDVRVGRRTALLGLGAGVGMLAALTLPNHLNWKSDSPYLDSVRGVVDYSSGSGRGRLIQYKNTLRMAEAHPVLGVGPGNWPVHYAKFAARNDPSLSRETGRPSNPWPSSDWVAMIAERGPIATLAFLLAYLGLFVSGWRRSGDEQSAADQLAPLAMMGTMAVTAVVGAFDAVLLLAAPALIAWSAFGALSVPGKSRVTLEPPDGTRRLWLAVGAVVGTCFVAWSASEIVAMSNNCSDATAVTLARCRTTVQSR